MNRTAPRFSKGGRRGLTAPLRGLFFLHLPTGPLLFTRTANWLSIYPPPPLLFKSFPEDGLRRLRFVFHCLPAGPLTKKHFAENLHSTFVIDFYAGQANLPRHRLKKTNGFPQKELFCLWAEMDSNHRRRKPADLQSALVGHLSISPVVLGAGLEPARISPHAPQACVSANFTTRAWGLKTSDMIPYVGATCNSKSDVFFVVAQMRDSDGFSPETCAFKMHCGRRTEVRRP